MEITDADVQLQITHQIRTLAWSPLGTLIATGSGDTTLRVWNPERPEAKYSTLLLGHTASIDRVAFNPGKVAELATCSSDGTLRIWDVRTKSAVKEMKFDDACYSLAWHPLGEGLLLNRKDTLVPIDYPSFKVLSEHKQTVPTNQAIFAWTGDYVFLTESTGRIKTVRWPSLDVVNDVQVHTAALFACDLTPNGDFLALGGSDSLITLWNPKDWFWKRSFSKMTGPVKTVSISFDSQYIVGGTDDGPGLDIADVYSGDYVHRIETGGAFAAVVQWSPRSYALAYSVGSGPGGLKVVGNFDHKTT